MQAASNTQTMFSMKNPTELWQDYQHGDQQAFRAIYQRFKQPLMHFLYRYQKDLQTRRDLLQETFYNACRSADTYNPQADAKFSTWLYAIATNTAKSWSQRPYNKLPTTRPYWPDGSQRVFTSDRPGPDAVVEHRENMGKLLQALHEIPWKYAEVVIMRDLEQKTYQEIQFITGLRDGTVKSRIHRGRNMLKGYL